MDILDTILEEIAGVIGKVDRKGLQASVDCIGRGRGTTAPKGEKHGYFCCNRN
jgi:hypothetical protein